MIVVVKPPAKLPEHGAGVGQGIEARIVAFEGAHKGQSVALISRRLFGNPCGCVTGHYRNWISNPSHIMDLKS